ncbi:hypothetical protein ILYODFUR_003965 [Ilyodon furcidens]|uniref:ADF-H domain-containing protein n=1 Tax=Ilyodon furcidens TaxID=33524 RepID=A0ABV0V023_9TELE
MASGVQVDDQVKDIINNMKVVKSDADANERIRLVILEIKDGYIKVENIYREKDLSGEDDIFKFFLSLLNKEKCRYLLYDCHFETKESSRKEELVFVMWAPETAPIKSKMQYASSKDSIKKVLTGMVLHFLNKFGRLVKVPWFKLTLNLTFLYSYRNQT